jgi:hypothetical protein
MNTTSGFRSLAIYAKHDLAIALERRGDQENLEESARLMDETVSEGEVLGMKRTVEKARLRSAYSNRIASGGREKKTEVRTIDEQQCAGPENGYQATDGACDATRQASLYIATHETATSNAQESLLFCREGDFWTVGYQNQTTRIRHLTGLTILAQLLVCPYREFHVLDLVSAIDGESPKIVRSASRGPTLDATAKRSYRERLRELHAEVEQARAASDRIRAEQAEAEMDSLTREIARAVGLGGKDRVTGSDSERARLRITNAIRLAIRKIGTHHEKLGRHLSKTVRTGSFCVYHPEPILASDQQRYLDRK